MPPLPPVPGVLKADVHFSVGSDLAALIRLKFTYTGGPPTSAQMNSLATSVRTAWTNRLQNLTGTNINLTSVVTQDLASNTGAQGVDSTVVAGTYAGSVLPAGTAVLINHSIARRYRGGKPRTYLPAGSAAALSGPSNWTATFQNGVTANFNLWMGDIVATAGIGITVQAHVNVSYFTGYTLGPAQPGGFRKKIPSLRGAPLVDIITTSNANSKPGSQRRRNLFSR